MKRRSVHGVMTLLVRTGFLQVIAIVATFLLTVFLDPAHYGVFAVTAAAADILVYFSDIGFAGALIQKKRLENDDLATTFTVQQLLSLSLVGIGFLATSIVQRTYGLSAEGIWLFRVLLVSFFLSTLKTIPSIRLERRLEFGKLIIPQIIENLAFYGAAVFFAWKGYGVTSFTVAVLVRSILGLIAMYAIEPWRPSIGINKNALKSLASFGLPFQLNSVLALVKDRFLVMYYGAVLPAAQVGYLQWAERWSLFPHRMVVDNVSRVTFPAYSRLQAKKEDLTRAIEKSLFFTSLVIFPALVGLIVLAPSLVRIIPRYTKWEPAILALTLFSVNAIWSSISTTLTNTFAALGKISINVKLMVLWTTLTWILTPVFISRYGYNGVALAAAVVAFSSVIPMFIIKRLLPVKLVQNILPALVSSLVMGTSLKFILSSLIPYSLSLIPLAVLAASGGILYVSTIFLLTGKKLILEIQKISRMIK